jgi:hypothetical protein
MRSIQIDLPEGIYTWEDWNKEVKEKYPIRYFINETLSNKISYFSRKIGNTVYYIKCHLIPRYRFHIINLSKIDPEYKYGYMDPCTIMLYSSFYALGLYIKECENIGYNPNSWDLPEDEIQKASVESQIATYNEAKELYNWWISKRFEENKEEERFYHKYRNSSGNDRTAAKHAWLSFEDSEEKAYKMLVRLAMISGKLWV